MLIFVCFRILKERVMKKILIYLTMGLALFGLRNAANAQYNKILDFNGTNGWHPEGFLDSFGKRAIWNDTVGRSKQLW